MLPVDIIRALHDDLASFRPAGIAPPHISIAVDPYDILERLFDGPRKWRIVLHWNGDTLQTTNTPEAAIVDHQIEIYVARHHGLAVDKGRSQTIANRPDGEPTLMELRTLTDSRLRSFSFDTTDQTILPHLNYRGTDPVAAPDGVMLAAYRMRYEVTAAAEQITCRPAAG